MCRCRDQLEERDSVEKGHAPGALGTEHDRSKFPRDSVLPGDEDILGDQLHS